MLWDLLVFALIGLIMGTAARIFSSVRQGRAILGTIIHAMLGALIGGMVSWSGWPAMEEQVYFANLLLAALGAVLGIVLGAGVSYAMRRNG